MSAVDILKHKEDVIAQPVAGEVVLFDLASGNYYSLNELGARIWELLDGKRALMDVADQLTSEYDAPAEEIARDLRALVEDMLRNGLLVEVEKEDSVAG
jgi:hypothetical protein